MHGGRVKAGRPKKQAMMNVALPKPAGGPPQTRRSGQAQQDMDRAGVGATECDEGTAVVLRDSKRGAFAWANLRQTATDHAAAGERLLIHTIADEVGINQYLPAVKKFLTYARDEKLACASWDDIDAALLRYLGKLCYYEGLHPHQGALAVNGYCYLYPEASRMLPRSWRATRGWSGFSIQFEGQPVALQLLACMEQVCWDSDKWDGLEAGDAMVLAADGYLREQDLFSLRVEDVIFTRNSSGGLEGAALLLGRAHRGESCKTGREQGVVMDEPLSVEVLERLCSNKASSARVFRINATIYRQWWKWAARKVLGPGHKVGPPHSARHTGASRDLTEQYRSLEAVMKRGRWKSLTAVQRYAKPHAWFACMAGLPADVLARGNALMAARAPRPLKAV